MDVRERADAGPAATRCPYCHDLLAVDAAQVECGGCATRHHAACLEELGRCTVLGCAWTPGGGPAPPMPSRPTEVYRRRVAERQRARAEAFRAGAEAAAGRPPIPPTIAPPSWELEDARQRAAADLEAMNREHRRVALGIAGFMLLVALVIYGVISLM